MVCFFCHIPLVVPALTETKMDIVIQCTSPKCRAVYRVTQVCLHPSEQPEVKKNVPAA
jgi:hypothetical protein